MAIKMSNWIRGIPHTTKRANFMRLMIFKLILILIIFNKETILHAAQEIENVRCSLSSIEQGYPDDWIPAVGIIEFSTREIKVPVQFFGYAQETWKSALTKTNDGTLAGEHFWNIQYTRTKEGKIDYLSFEFENPLNLGLPNEETSYLATAYCN